MALRSVHGCVNNLHGRWVFIVGVSVLCFVAGINVGNNHADVPPGPRLFQNQPVSTDPHIRLPPCPAPEQIRGLGHVPVYKQLRQPLWQLIADNQRHHVTAGGGWAPSNCTARHRVAILVPYRDRDAHLLVFLQHMHDFLQRQYVQYGIYVIEQTDRGKFNRARLLNVGFLEATKDGSWDCVVFHDVDLLPTNTRNLYYCPAQPRHLSVAVDTLGNRLLYEGQFGGVSAMTVAHFKQVNGYSNMYWGWGGEDDDMAIRIDVEGLSRLRYPPEVATYTMLRHEKEHSERYDQSDRRELLLTALYRIKYDGFKNTAYTLTHMERNPLYTKYSVQLKHDLPEMKAYIRRLKIPHVVWTSGLKFGTEYQKITW